MELFFCRHSQGRKVSRALLAWAARECWGLEELPELARGEFGKPYFPGRKELHFNLSHTGTLLLCALDSAPVGADVQLLRDPRPSLAARVFSPAELAWFQSQGGGAGPFCRLWVLKESRVKHDGTGLTYSIRSVPIPLPPEPGESVRHDGLVFTALAGEDWQAAVCGHSTPGQAVWVPAQEL